MSVTVYRDTIEGACGISVLYDFQEDDGNDGWESATSPTATSYGGAGWVSAGFINTSKCREVYEELNDKFTLVYQTPVRLNLNSRNLFFFAIWDTSGVNIPHGYDKKIDVIFDTRANFSWMLPVEEN